MDCSSPGSSVPFSRESSRSGVRTWVCHIAGRLFTVLGTREARGPKCSQFLDMISDYILVGGAFAGVKRWGVEVRGLSQAAQGWTVVGPSPIPRMQLPSLGFLGG